MLRLNYLLTVVALLGMTGLAHGGITPPPEGIRLFNGENLDGFYTWIRDRGRDTDPENVFTVHDGMLHISGKEWGCVTSDEEYENYHLVAEFKWGEITHEPRIDRARDSGILVNSTGEDGGYSGIWMKSIEVQMIEGGTGDLLVVGDKSTDYELTATVADASEGVPHVYKEDGTPLTINGGRIDWWGRDPGWEDVKDFRGAQDVEYPVGKWNRVEAIVAGDRITVFLNGVKVNECYGVKPTSGRLQIQSEGAEVFVRRFDLLPIGDEVAPVLGSRFIYNSDASNMFIDVEPPMTPEGLYPYVDEVAGTQVTTFAASPNFGMVMSYPSKVATMLGTDVSEALAATIAPSVETKPTSTERAAVNLRALVEAGHNPLDLIIDRANEKGLETFVSFRLNEVHAVEQEDHLILSRFWKEHPEWRIGKVADPLSDLYVEILGPRTSPIVGTWLPAGLNFAVPEVRAQRLAELRECCEMFNADGLELDFQRFPMYFKQGEEADHIATMTAWMRDVRAMTREVGEKRGRPILLTARVMAKPEQNLGIGLDPVTWANEGLIDFVIVSHYLRNDFPLPVTEYRQLLPPSMPIYASIEVEPEQDTYRTMAWDLYQDGADGISLFNFFTTRERGEGPPFELLNELGEPTTIEPVAQEQKAGEA